MKHKKEYLLFDLDGTITDPGIGITKSVQYSLRHFGINVENLRDLSKFIGPPLRDSYKNFYGFDDESAELAVKKYREYFADTGIFENTLYDGMDSLLKHQRDIGKKLVIATSKPAVFAERILEHFHIAEYFSFVAGSELDGRRSIKSEVIQYAIDNVKIISVCNAVMIGDREHDIFGAKAVGMESIGVLYGYGNLQEHQNAGADRTAESVEQLDEILTEEF